ncbi:hypothetical protein HGRIS_004371 [Hohenbuehelia grisea]|uniref:Zn(2)-C6 fungal-type domain-containing protein n=1 Tax=Hohenbuehelia grisea TaxID=104357 RepID=A0ABR3JC88_9AGAR
MATFALQSIIDRIQRKSKYLPPQALEAITHPVILPFVKRGMFQSTDTGADVATYSRAYPHLRNPKEWDFDYKKTCRACRIDNRTCYFSRDPKVKHCSACTHDKVHCQREFSGAEDQESEREDDADGDDARQVAAALFRAESTTPAAGDGRPPSATPAPRVIVRYGRRRGISEESPEPERMMSSRRRGKRRRIVEDDDDDDQPEAGPSGLSHAQKRARVDANDDEQPTFASTTGAAPPTATAAGTQTEPQSSPSSTQTRTSCQTQTSFAPAGRSCSSSGTQATQGTAAQSSVVRPMPVNNASIPQRMIFSLLSNNPNEVYVMSGMEITCLQREQLFNRLGGGDEKFQS